jgi:hypothetical protein
MLHPHNNGIIDKSSVFFLPYAFIIGVDTNDPIGVASECIDAIVKDKKKCGLKNKVNDGEKDRKDAIIRCNITLY